jgi:Peptidase family M28
MRHLLLLAAAPLLAVSAHAQSSQPGPGVRVEDLRRHIEVLASDAYEGRKPGTAGEAKTVLYIATELARIGLDPAAGNGSWYQPVPLVKRKPFAHRATWTAAGKTIDFEQEDLILIGKDPVERIVDAPVYFVGHGLVSPERGVDQLEGADLKGAVALILFDAPRVPGFPDYSERARAVREAGAAATIAVIGDDVPWSSIRSSYRMGQTGLQTEAVAQVQGAMPLAAASRLAEASGQSFEELLDSAPGPEFKAVRLAPRATLDISSYVYNYSSHNVIGRLRGTGAGGESVMYLGHWDHLGICREEGAEDRICNGAVDNASGIAMMIETARNVGRGPRPARDLLFMATTAEEMGLLGAEYFGANPSLPLNSIVAAINMDTVAIHGRGEPVAVIGRGIAPLDAVIAQTVSDLGRRLDTDEEADAFVQRQDGWELAKAGVPTVMVGASFSNMHTLNAFLSGPYHKPDDDLGRAIVLEGAAEDTDLLIALGRRLADPSVYQPPVR